MTTSMPVTFILSAYIAICLHSYLLVDHMQLQHMVHDVHSKSTVACPGFNLHAYNTKSANLNLEHHQWTCADTKCIK